MPSRTIENYLKQIYLEQIKTPDTTIAMGRLASVMQVVPGTATAMVKALADSGLVDYSPRTGVQLTTAGNQLALHVLRRHRLVECFLVKTLGLDWSEVHEEAEELEHVISEKVLEKIDILLGHPTVDPHGDPIPTAAGHIAADVPDTLVTCQLDQPMEITRILDQEPRFLQFVNQRSLTPGACVRVRQRDELSDAITVEHCTPSKTLLTLSTAVARKFLVRQA